MDPELFFPHVNNALRPEVEEICAHCPVYDACLDWALHYEDRGYWAGTTALRRAKLRERRGIKLERLEYRPAPRDPCGTPGGYQRHRRHNEEPCSRCREAWNRNWEMRRAEKREAERVEAEERPPEGLR
jgi:hypothetical protein